MKSRKIQIGIALLFGFGCLYLFAKDQDWSKVWEAMKGVHLGWVALAALLSVNSVLIRAIRWQALLGNPKVPVNQLFMISNIGFMGNGIFPIRMGELLRPFLVWRYSTHAFSTALATIIVERVYDLMGLLLCLAFVLAIFPFPAQTPALGAAQELSVSASPEGNMPQEIIDKNPLDFIKDMAYLGAYFFILMFGGIAVISYAPEWSLRVARLVFKPLPQKITEKILKAIESFEKGAITFRNPKAFLYCVVWTLVLWVSIAFSELVVLWALDITSVSFTGSLFIMIGLCFAVMFPQAPGYIGVYQLAVWLILVKTFHIESTLATAAAWIMWLTQCPPVILAGFISLLIMGISLKEISHVREKIPEGTNESPVG